MPKVIFEEARLASHVIHLGSTAVFCPRPRSLSRDGKRENPGGTTGSRECDACTLFSLSDSMISGLRDFTKKMIFLSTSVFQMFLHYWH